MEAGGRLPGVGTRLLSGESLSSPGSEIPDLEMKRTQPQNATSDTEDQLPEQPVFWPNAQERGCWAGWLTADSDPLHQPSITGKSCTLPAALPAVGSPHRHPQLVSEALERIRLPISQGDQRVGEQELTLGPP